MFTNQKLLSVAAAWSHNFHATGKRALYSFLAILVGVFFLSNTLTSFVRYLWNDVGNNYMYTYSWLLARCSATTLATWGQACVHLFLFWSVSSIYCFIDLAKPHWLAAYKIQPDVHASREDYVKCVKQALFNQMFVGVPFVVGFHYATEWRTDSTYTHLSTWPSFYEFILHLGLILLIEEFWFYYAHRLFHMGALYKYVHKRHHQFQAPVAMSAIYAHPVEHAMANLFPVHLGPFLLGSHLSTTTVWFIVATLNTMNAHSGYHLPFFPSPEAHDFHHLKFGNNFGVLGILDALHGTDNEFRKSQKFSNHVVTLFGNQNVVETNVIKK